MYLLTSSCATAALLWVIMASDAWGAPRPREESPVLLELEGVIVGLLQSSQGGEATGIVVSEPPVPDSPFVKKHIGNVKYEDISVNVGVPMRTAFWEWISDSMRNSSSRKSGSIVYADYDFIERARREFVGALITEIGFPACDGASKDPAYISVKFTPEITHFKQGSGRRIVLPSSAKQKRWLASNFRLSIDGLDTSRVNKIDALTIKQTTRSLDGNTDIREKEPGKLEFPALVISVPEVLSRSFVDWHEDFVIKGNNDDSKERDGTLEYLSPLNEKLFELKFGHLGIFKVGNDRPEFGNIRRVKAEMYCEEIGVKYGGGASWASLRTQQGTGLASSLGERSY